MSCILAFIEKWFFITFWIYVSRRLYLNARRCASEHSDPFEKIVQERALTAKHIEDLKWKATNTEQRRRGLQIAVIRHKASIKKKTSKIVKTARVMTRLMHANTKLRASNTVKDEKISGFRIVFAKLEQDLELEKETIGDRDKEIKAIKLDFGLQLKQVHTELSLAMDNNNERIRFLQDINEVLRNDLNTFTEKYGSVEGVRKEHRKVIERLHKSETQLEKMKKDYHDFKKRTSLQLQLGKEIELGRQRTLSKRLTDHNADLEDKIGNLQADNERLMAELMSHTVAGKAELRQRMSATPDACESDLQKKYDDAMTLLDETVV